MHLSDAHPPHRPCLPSRASFAVWFLLPSLLLAVAFFPFSTVSAVDSASVSPPPTKNELGQSYQRVRWDWEAGASGTDSALTNGSVYGSIFQVYFFPATTNTAALTTDVVLGASLTEGGITYTSTLDTFDMVTDDAKMVTNTSAIYVSSPLTLGIANAGVGDSGTVVVVVKP